MIGCERKLRRIFKNDGKALILPLDHGASEGMIPGVDKIPELLAWSSPPAVQAVVLNKGAARAKVLGLAPDLSCFIQLSGGTKHGLPTYYKSLVCSVPEALRLGADGVCVQVNIGNDLEDRMLSDFGLVVDEAHGLGAPVMAVLYPRGGQIVDERDPSLVAHCIRLGGEMAADVVVVPYSGDPASFSAAVLSCPCPVLVAGGAPASFDLFLENVREAMECGARGVCAGRCVLQQANPIKAVEKLAEIVRLA